MTLFINGMIICGYIISDKEYFESYTKGINHAENDFFKKYYNNGNKEPSYINLREPKVLSNTINTMNLNNAVWRGRIDKVCGFIDGVIQIDEA